MRRSTQRVTMPLMQQSGNALTERKCSALGELINTFVLVYVENLPAQADGSCVIQVPEIQVTCNTGSRNATPTYYARNSQWNNSVDCLLACPIKY